MEVYSKPQIDQIGVKTAEKIKAAKGAIPPLTQALGQSTTSAVSQKLFTDTVMDITKSRLGFAARKSNTSIPANIFTTVSFSIVDDDTHNLWDGTTFTVPANMQGMYEVFGHFTFDNVEVGKKAIVGINVNGNLRYGGLLGRGVSGGSDLTGYGGALRLKLNAGDKLTMTVYAGNSTTGHLAATTTESYSTFSAYKMV